MAGGTMDGDTRHTQGCFVVDRSSSSSVGWAGGGFEGRAEGGRLEAGLEMEGAEGGGLLLYTIGSRRGLS